MIKNVSKWMSVFLLLALCLAPAIAQGAKINFNPDVLEKIRAAAVGEISSVQGTYEKGDRGSNVIKIKERMQKLGYYREDASFGDDYNDTMVQRVKLFQENNRLEVTGKIDSRTLSKLKESSPVPGEYYTGSWTEPDVTLIIPENTYGQWQEKSSNRFNFRIKVKNISQRRTVKAIEFYVYTKDVWGDELISEDYPYRYTVETSFKPGAMGYTGYMTIPDRRETEEVYIAIHKVRYSDGTTKTVSSPEYYRWIIKW